MVLYLRKSGFLMKKYIISRLNKFEYWLRKTFELRENAFSLILFYTFFQEMERLLLSYRNLLK